MQKWLTPSTKPADYSVIGERPTAAFELEARPPRIRLKKGREREGSIAELGLKVVKKDGTTDLQSSKASTLSLSLSLWPFPFAARSTILAFFRCDEMKGENIFWRCSSVTWFEIGFNCAQTSGAMGRVWERSEKLDMSDFPV